MKIAAKAWCPGAHRPMEAGDGLILRLRPPMGRLTAEQATAIATLALRFGSGIVEFTRRANLQIRGVSQAAHGPLLSALAELGLIDPDARSEGRRNILVDPLWQAEDDTPHLAASLAERLGELPDLPAKFGFAVDAGPAPMLVAAPADIRIERGRSGGLILRPDGEAAGRSVTPENAVQAALALARWFVKTGGAASGRMARHLAALPLPARPAGDELPAPAAAPLAPGPSDLGPVVGAPFGQTGGDMLARLVVDSGARALRLTPWRLLVLEGGRPGAFPGFATVSGDPLLAVDACPGAPLCASAAVETRRFARSLAGRIAGSLHVSGCPKGCARSAAADLTLVGRDGGFDLVRGGRASDAPAETGLSPATLLSRYGCPDAAPV